MFKPIEAIVNAFRKAAKTVPLLSREDAAALVLLRTYAEWSAFLSYVDAECMQRADALLYEHDAIKNAFMRGQITMLRELPLLIERTAKMHADARERAINKPAISDRDASRTAALYATPSWPSAAQRQQQR